MIFLLFLPSVIVIQFNNNQPMPFEVTPNILLQKQENLPSGCCFHLITYAPPPPQQESYMRTKARSEPKLHPQKKIDLVTLKRGVSLNRLHRSPLKSVKDVPQNHLKPQNKAPTHPKRSRDLDFKYKNFQKGFINTVKGAPNPSLKIEAAYPVVLNGPKISAQQGLPDNTKLANFQEDLTNVPYLSEISVVSEDFISRQSLEVNIFTYLSTPLEKKSMQASTIEQQSACSLASEKVEGRTPLQRMLDRNRAQKGLQGKKRLVL